MKRWPRHQLREKRVDARHRVMVYRRNDKAGKGPCVSLYCGSVEILRFDLFEDVPHYHQHPASLARIPWEPGLPFARYVELALEVMLKMRPQTAKVVDWMRAELGVAPVPIS